MVSIEKKPRRSAMDYSICGCLALLLFLVLILFDFYEYITVPGAKHARHHIRTGVKKVYTSVNTMAALVEQMTAEEKQELEREAEEAEELVHKKHDEVEEIVERVEEMEKELHSDVKSDATEEMTDEGKKAAAIISDELTEEEKAAEEEKKEEIVEATVEKELGLDNWCGGCQWNNMGFNCDKRVSWMMQTYSISEAAAKEANIDVCSSKGRRRMLRHRV